MARSAYIDGLNQNSSPDLEDRIRASLAYVYFFQYDFTTALEESVAAASRRSVS